MLSFARHFLVPFITEYSRVISVAVIEATKSTLRNDTTISKIIYISLGVTSAILLLAIAIIVWCYRRTKKKTVQRYEPFIQMCQPHRTACVYTRKLKQTRF